MDLTSMTPSSSWGRSGRTSVNTSTSSAELLGGSVLYVVALVIGAQAMRMIGEARATNPQMAIRAVSLMKASSGANGGGSWAARRQPARANDSNVRHRHAVGRHRPGDSFGSRRA